MNFSGLSTYPRALKGPRATVWMPGASSYWI